MDWFEIENISTIDSPALVVYRDRVRQNIARAVRMIGDPNKLRPHVKTNKIAEVCSLMMDAGISKFKCATIAEAEMLAQINAKDVLLAYQPVGPKAERFIELIKQYPATYFSCLVDHIVPAQHLSELGQKYEQTIHVYIDLNTGMNRTGIQPAHALYLFEAIQLLPFIRVIGLHAYDGNIRDTDLTVRQHKSDEAFQKVLILSEALESVTNHPLTVVVGGTPTFPTHIHRENVECSPGTFVFWDWGYKQIAPDEPFEYAALVITRVISLIDHQTVCLDLGHKSVAAENPLPRVAFLNAPEALPVSQSEEHMVIKVPDASIYTIGDVLYAVPVHICPTVALYDTAVVIENNNAVGFWDVVARKRKINI
ncbi:D-TA family PLP-dependent enzyme [Danxiaibacter flavus]|uniref:D-TA family PLP-dependent enzyme n=1 Tax=Danxiaibacter flavus TaxID=3049108 RepID=A0ABV3Z9Y8_9BACT|nr:D-TA family PLP-dependent enzyme [Chitinophagaceae bacterium DXS]